MAKEPGTIESAIMVVSEILQPINAATKDSKSAKRLINELGFELPSGIDDIGLTALDVSDLINKILEIKSLSESEWDDISVTAPLFADLLISIENLISDITTLANNLNSNLASDYLTKTNIVKELWQRIFDYLIIHYVTKSNPLVSGVLYVLGIFEDKSYTTDSANYQTQHVRRIIHYSRIIDFFSSPANLFKDVYGWGTTDFKASKLFKNLATLVAYFGIGSYSRNMPGKLEEILTGNSASLSQADPMPQLIVGNRKTTNSGTVDSGISFFKIRPSSPGSTDGGIGVVPWIRGDLDESIPFPWGGGLLNLVIDSTLSIENGIYAKILPGKDINIDSNFLKGAVTSVLNGHIAIGLEIKENKTDKYTLISLPANIKLKFSTFRFLIGGKTTGSKGDLDLFFELEIDGGQLTIDKSESDGFISSIIPAKSIDVQFDIKINYSPKQGIHIENSGSFEISFELNKKIGPFSLKTLYISIGGSKQSIKLNANISGSVTLGPLCVTVDKIGAYLSLEFKDGNAGPLNISPGFNPPKGVGISIDASAIKGSGYLYFDPDNEEYAGALELTIQGTISVKAIGIVTTKMPDGSKGYSLLILITAEFTPIQLGYGFTLNGVGGLLGLNRTVVVEKLRTGVKDNSLKSILFPENVVANISRIISDLKQVFPAYQSHFVIGPMGKLGYGTPTLISLELGIIIEIPDPLIAILGVLKTILPHETQPILKLQVNFLGIIDFTKKEISFDASLYGSRLLIFTLSGDMALRINWGDNPVFILSVGGFHPDFKEIPAGLTDMKRLSINLLSGDNPRISIETYFAVTSNTVQFGAKAELYAAACGFNVYGYIGFDVLFQFDPFYFVASVYAGLALRSGTTVLLGVQLSGQLSGPKPWNAKGKASFRIIFKFTISFDKTWGEESDEGEKELADVYAELKTALSDDRNWLAEIPSNNSLNVTIKKSETKEDQIIIHPFGVLSVSQKVVPLELTIDKYGNKQPQDETKFTISSIKSKTYAFSTSTVLDYFAPANFIELSDSEKLSRKSYEKLKSGKKLSASSNLVSGKPVEKTVDYELSYLKRNIFKLMVAGIYKCAMKVFMVSLKGNAAHKSTLSFSNSKMSVNAPKHINIEAEKFAIANTSDLTLAGAGMIASSQTEAYAMLKEMINKKPELRNTVQVVQHNEINMI